MKITMLLLRFKLVYLEHEYPFQERIDEMWGALEIYLLDSEVVEVLLKFEWDISELIEWYLDKHIAMFSEGFPYAQSGENLDQALDRIHKEIEKVDDDDIDELYKWDELLYRFRSSHCLRWGMNGSRVPALIIGLNHGYGEISLNLKPESGFMEEKMDDYPGYYKPGSWAYTFDQEEFKVHFKQEIFNFLSDALQKAREPKSRTLAEKLLKRTDGV
jgi:hypothetical protein